MSVMEPRAWLACGCGLFADRHQQPRRAVVSLEVGDREPRDLAEACAGRDLDIKTERHVERIGSLHQFAEPRRRLTYQYEIEAFGEPAEAMTPRGGVGDAMIAPGGESDAALGGLWNSTAVACSCPRPAGRRARRRARARSNRPTGWRQASVSGACGSSRIGSRAAAGDEIALIGGDGVGQRPSHRRVESASPPRASLRAFSMASHHVRMCSPSGFSKSSARPTRFVQFPATHQRRARPRAGRLVATVARRDAGRYRGEVVGLLTNHQLLTGWSSLPSAKRGGDGPSSVSFILLGPRLRDGEDVSVPASVRQWR